MSSQEAVHVSPSDGNTETGQRDSGYLAVPSSARWPDYKAGITPTHVVERGCGQTTEDGVYANQRLSLAEGGKAYGRKAKISNRTGEIPPSGIIGGPRGEKAADKAESLAGCKSLYRQLPVFGRLAYPVRAEVTKHDMPGRKSPGCPAAVFAAVGTTWGASKLGGRNITKYLHPRNMALREVVFAG